MPEQSPDEIYADELPDHGEELIHTLVADDNRYALAVSLTRDWVYYSTLQGEIRVMSPGGTQDLEIHSGLSTVFPAVSLAAADRGGGSA